MQEDLDFQEAQKFQNPNFGGPSSGDGGYNNNRGDDYYQEDDIRNPDDMFEENLLGGP